MASFNNDWKFARFGAMPDGSQLDEPKGLETADFNDSDWRTLNTPHDWGIEDPFRDDLPNRTGKLPRAGIGWYRKSFQSLETVSVIPHTQSQAPESIERGQAVQMKDIPTV